MGNPLADGGGSTARVGDVIYNSNGEAFVWTGSGYDRAPNLDNARGGAGYVSRSASSSSSQSFQDPRALEIEARQVDAQIQDAQGKLALAQQSQDFQQAQYYQQRLDALAQQRQTLQYNYQQLAQQAQLAGQAQEFQGGQNALDRAQQASLARGQQEFQGGESALDRAARASEFGATYGLQTAQATEQARQARIAALQAGARQLSDVISNVDPAAAAAFSLGGGGVLANALAGGRDALSTGALLPAARTLKGIEDLATAPLPTFGGYSAPAAAPARPALVDTTYNANAPWQTAPGSSYRPSYGAPVASPTTAPAAAPAYSGMGVATPLVTNQVAGSASPFAGFAQQAQEQGRTLGSFAYGTRMRPRYATGSFITGDSTDPANPAAGGAHPELVGLQDPPGANNARATVTPLTPPGIGDTGMGGMGGGATPRPALAALFMDIGKLLGGEDSGPAESAEPPRFATGTDIGNGSDIFGTPVTTSTEDQPYLDRVRQLRQGIDTTPPVEGGLFNVGFNNQPGIVQSRYLASLQSRYGAPAADFAQQARRFAFPGADRGNFTLGYGYGTDSPPIRRRA